MKPVEVERAPREVFDGLASSMSFRGLREALRTAIAAISIDARSDADRRAAVLDLLRDALAQGRARARTQLEAGGRGTNCGRLLSELEDELIGVIYDYVVGYVHVADNPALVERLAIVAVGG